MTMLIEQKLPGEFDPFQAAASEQCFAGSIALRDLSRLNDVLVSQDGEATISIQAGIDEESFSFIRGSLKASVFLTCQRCGEPVAHELNASFLLSPVYDDKQARQLPRLYEPLMVSSENLVEMASIVEEEILLQLPMVARHARGHCPVSLPDYLL